MSRTSGNLRRGRAPVLIARLLMYLVTAWVTIATLASGLFPHAGAAVVLLALYTTAPLVAFIKWRGWPFYPTAAFRLAVVRPFWYTQLALPLVGGSGLLGLAIGAPFGRAILFGRAGASIALVVLAVGLFIGYLGSRRLVVRNVDVTVRNLAAEFEGLRIVQLSDLHIGPHTSRKFLSRVVDATQALSPEIIAVTGDLIDDRSEDVAAYARALRELKAPLGVFMIPGNHDVYAGWDDVERNLRDAQLGTVLVNEHVLVRQGNATLAIVGTGDPAGGAKGTSRSAPDVDLALARIPASATVIAFAHNPALWPALESRGVALTLSGHTHWGQLALPTFGWSLASPFLEYAMGAHVKNDSALYISPGTGYWGIPFRIGASPEVTLITLKTAARVSARMHAPTVLRRRKRRKKRSAAAAAV